MTYVVDHFLRRPGAFASHTGDPLFEYFTFDHVAAGVVVACRRDTRRLWAIEVHDNEVVERDLVPGVEEWRV